MRAHLAQPLAQALEVLGLPTYIRGHDQHFFGIHFDLTKHTLRQVDPKRLPVMQVVLIPQVDGSSVVYIALANDIGTEVAYVNVSDSPMTPKAIAELLLTLLDSWRQIKRVEVFECGDDSLPPWCRSQKIPSYYGKMNAATYYALL